MRLKLFKHTLLIEWYPEHQHRKVKHMKVWNRKGNCPGCNVMQGSKHKVGCQHRIKMLKEANAAAKGGHDGTE